MTHKTFPSFQVFLMVIQLASVQAQISNDEQYNFLVRTTGYRYDPDDQNGTNYITFLLRAAITTIGQDNCLIDLEDGSGYSHEVRFDYDTPETRTDAKFIRKLLTVSGGTQRYYLTWYAFQNNCDPRLEYEGDCCGLFCLGTEDIGLQYQCRSADLHFFQTGPLNGEWYAYWRLTNQNVGVRIEHTWRYHFGDGRFRPLTFGTIPNGGSKRHFNKNNTPVGGSHQLMGYANHWGSVHHPAFGDGPDVTYSFSIDQQALVTISTLFASTTFDSRLHLLSKDGNSWSYIASNADFSNTESRAHMEKILPVGEYFAIVEGDNGAEGKFLLEIAASPGETLCEDLIFTFAGERDQIWNIKSATSQPSAIIDANQRIILNAETFVELKPGFEIQSGGRLDIKMQPCVEN